MKVILTKVDEVHMVIDADDSIYRELYDFFSFEVPGAKFMPAVRNRFWDGYIRLFNIKTKKIYMGLFPYIYEFCKEHNYELETDGEVNYAENRTLDEIKEWANHSNIAQSQSYVDMTDRRFERLLNLKRSQEVQEVQEGCTAPHQFKGQ